MNERDLFLKALDLTDPVAREALLDRECADSPELRSRVDALFAAAAAAGPFLDQPHPAAGQADAVHTGPYAGSRGDRAADLVGSVIAGKYKLLQVIGEGGMGAVYMADQTEPVKRRVAVKLIRTERGNSKTILSRFEAERQAIALMDHPHIAKLLDAGTTAADEPYFVMELVKGVPLAQYCDEHKLNIPDRLNLFTQICSAVQHAHQKGIIHRDLKPGNILVESHDDKPVPRVIDFGLAKATSGMQLTEHTLFTVLGTVAGTPLYMAPEQAKFNAIDVDTRADIYALGVILYELLTGTTPIERETFKKAAFDEMLRVIREDEPPSPSKRLSSTESKPSVAANRRTEPEKLGRFVRGELDWIVMKALSKERDRRYETANGFAKDIERFMNHEPVLAGPPSARYKLRKFVQRNRGQVVASSVVLLALVAGIAGTTVGLIRSEQQRKKAEQAEDDTLAAYQATTDDAIEQLIGSKPDLGPEERIYLELTRKRWQVFAARQGDDERTLFIRGEGHFRVALLWQKLDQFEEARAEYLTSLAIQKQLVEQFPAKPVYQMNLAVAHHNLGNVLSGLGNVEAAQAEFLKALAIHNQLVEQSPAESKHKHDLAISHNSLGGVHDKLGEFEESCAEYRAAREILKKLVDQFPDIATYQHGLASTQRDLGQILASLGKVEEAQVEFIAARSIQKELVTRFPAKPDYQSNLAHTHNALGRVLSRFGQLEKARAELVTARNLFRQLVDRFPAVPHYVLRLAHTQLELSKVLSGLGVSNEARAEVQAAREIYKKLVDQFPSVVVYQRYLAAAHRDLGTYLFLDLKKPQEALAEYQAAFNLQRKFLDLPEYRLGLARTHNNLGCALADLGKHEEARAEYQEAISLRKSLVDKFPLEYQLEQGGTYLDLGDLFWKEGKPAESRNSLDLAIQFLKPVYEKHPGYHYAKPWLSLSHSGRARAYDRLQNPAEAIKDWNSAIELSPSVERPGIRAKRAVSLVHAGQVAEAVAEVAELTAPVANAPSQPKWNAGQWYDFACVYGIASGRIVDKKQEYADRAMELLQKAVKAGYSDAAHMKKDTDFDPLRGREDFKKLLAELEKRANERTSQVKEK